ncbi:AI-2E family transporter [Pseudonocardia sp. KRD-182]|uniref:AI-2E family transporter n=1 Tax=Pseudonocardia oceani TaxID=2792013 RepID=A0ABS6U222_9PSEU|nr:AI-2E family transporter [Pseudonocardia oceani]MBW0126270.1 AI-2E family transporter [Pseudonocardia oceani]
MIGRTDFSGALVACVGAFVPGLVAVLAAFAAGGLGQAVAVLVLIIAIQQVDGNIVQPLIMGRVIRLSAFTVIVAVRSPEAPPCSAFWGRSWPCRWPPAPRAPWPSPATRAGSRPATATLDEHSGGTRGPHPTRAYTPSPGGAAGRALHRRQPRARAAQRGRRVPRTARRSPQRRTLGGPAVVRVGTRPDHRRARRRARRTGPARGAGPAAS